ncbi:hypothetical protein PIIN_06891 [Serendipita indica DSM 11827]|uniref:F-box domain-containing protein n=1 Tax=Serendipita indica (strain DSM 11827) TaxID=1109443 RepID=G4U380_SERID|nr:hypothetical protein PIIN_06891 [Serendipita indica DSM 11827]
MSQLQKLRKTLSDVTAIRNALIKELQPFELAPSPSLVPIEKIPNENLIQIFDYAIQDCHPDICCLLLVSKRWHNLVMKTSSLWARIELVCRRINNRPTSLPHVSYVKACYTRSMERLLDVVIDYTSFLTDYNSRKENIEHLTSIVESKGESSFLIKDLWENKDSVFDEECDCDDCSASRWDEAYGYEYEYGYKNPRKLVDESTEARKRLLNRVEALGLELGTDNGKLMGRWKSANILIPSSVATTGTRYDEKEFAKLKKLVLAPLVGDTPSLLTLQIRNIHVLPFLKRLDKTSRMANVHSLTLDALEYFPSCLQSDALHYLSIGHVRNYNQLAPLATLPSLQELKFLNFSSPYSYYSQQLRLAPQTIIRLKGLKKLSFRYQSHLDRYIRFETPHLEEVHVKTLDDTPDMGISTSTLVWEPWYWNENVSRETCRKILDSAFVWLGLAHTLILRNFPEDFVLEYLKDREHPSTLRVIYVDELKGVPRAVYVAK